MELLLNVVWIGLGLAFFAVLLRKRGRWYLVSRVPYVTALLALTCVLVLLFPVVSASDDLHPSQAMFEDASKRSQRFASLLRLEQQQLLEGFLPSLLWVGFLTLPLVSFGMESEAPWVQELARARTPRAGRAPPSL